MDLYISLKDESFEVFCHHVELIGDFE